MNYSNIYSLFDLLYVPEKHSVKLYNTRSFAMFCSIERSVIIYETKYLRDILQNIYPNHFRRKIIQ